MSIYIRHEDEKKQEKVMVWEYSGVYKDLYSLLNGELVQYEKFIDSFDKIKEEAKETFKKFKSNQVSLWFMGWNEREPYAEFHIGRIETDEEFNERIKRLDNQPKVKRENDIKYLKKMAEKYNFNLIEK